MWRLSVWMYEWVIDVVWFYKISNIMNDYDNFEMFF